MQKDKNILNQNGKQDKGSGGLVQEGLDKTQVVAVGLKIKPPLWKATGKKKEVKNAKRT